MYGNAPTSPNADAARGYAASTSRIGTPRSVEHQAFQRVTSILSAARDDTVSIGKRAEAVYMNTRLWLTLAADLASPENALPAEVRAQLFSLAEFSRKHGLAVISGKASIDDLIAINTAIMKGLRGDGGEAAAANAPSGAETAV